MIFKWLRSKKVITKVHNRYILRHWGGSRQCVHGFFTREGGMSKEPYESLNCGYGSNDKSDHIERNRLIVMQELDVKPTLFLTGQQVHGNECLVVHHPDDIKKTPECDAMITKERKILLGVLTADCTPILLWERKNNIIGVIHAGWKGALGDIIANTIHKITHELHGSLDHIEAFIGPSIAQDSYQVDGNFKKQFCQKDMMNFKFFKNDPLDSEKFLFDLPGFNKHKLVQAGVKTIFHLDKDTYNHKDEFFSCRRSYHGGAQDFGRQISCIMLR